MNKAERRARGGFEILNTGSRGKICASFALRRVLSQRAGQNGAGSIDRYFPDRGVVASHIELEQFCSLI